MKSLMILILLSSTMLLQGQNIGLNVTNPEEDLHMKGDVRIDDDSESTILKLIKAKKAFRIGDVDPSYLDIDSIGLGSFTSGLNGLALGEYSATFGMNNRVLGENSFATGKENKVNGEHCFSAGFRNTVNGDYNSTFGQFHNVTGLFNFIAGYNNSTSRTASTVFGASNTVNSDGTLAAGIQLTANSYGGVYFGRYNTEYTSANYQYWVSTDPLMVIGNGTSNTFRNNAFVVLKNGKVGIDVDQPTEQLDVNGNIKTSGNFIGDGSQLTNLQGDGHWLMNSSTVYNTTRNVSIGSTGTSHNLSVIGDDGIYFNYQNPPTSSGTGLEIRMLSPGKGSTFTSSNTGVFLDVKATNASNIGYYALVEGDNLIKNQSGFVANVRGTADLKFGVSGYVSEAGNSNIGGSFSAEDATTENIGVKAIAEGPYGTAVGMYAEGIGFGNLAGEFIGDVEMSDDLNVADLTTTSRLKVGPGTSSNFRAMQGGTFVVGADNTTNDQAPADGIKVLSVSFPYSFPTTPKIVVTSSTQTGATFNDVFSVTTRSVTTSGCVLIIKRLDSDYEWAQNLRVDWFGFSF